MRTEWMTYWTDYKRYDMGSCLFGCLMKRVLVMPICVDI